MTTEPATLAVIVITSLVSWQVFQRSDLYERLLFSTDAVWRGRQFERLVTSGFIHGDWQHLIFNMLSFYFFASGIERWYGADTMLLVYFAGILGGNLLSLWLHRHHVYRALGASGGVCGIIFASIFLLPGGQVRLLLLPIGIPAWLFAIGYIVASYYEMRQQRDNIGHDAHLGGAIIGLLMATALHPAIVRASPVLYAVVMGLAVLLFVHLLRHPLYLPWTPRRRRSEPESHPRYTTRHLEDPREVDRLLEKVAAQGINSLSEDERKRLERYSNRLKDKDGT